MENNVFEEKGQITVISKMPYPDKVKIRAGSSRIQPLT